MFAALLLMPLALAAVAKPATAAAAARTSLTI